MIPVASDNRASAFACGVSAAMKRFRAASRLLFVTLPVASGRARRVLFNNDENIAGKEKAKEKERKYLCNSATRIR